MLKKNQIHGSFDLIPKCLSIRVLNRSIFVLKALAYQVLTGFRPFPSRSEQLVQSA